MKYSKFFPLSLLMLMSLLSGCNSSASIEESPSGTIKFSTLAGNSNDENQKIVIFRDQLALDSSLANYTNLMLENTVDFSKSQIVLISTTMLGYGESLTVNTVEEFTKYIKLKLIHTKPGNYCIVPSIAITPFLQLIEIESRKDLIIEERMEFNNCNENQTLLN